MGFSVNGRPVELRGDPSLTRRAHDFNTLEEGDCCWVLRSLGESNYVRDFGYDPSLPTDNQAHLTIWTQPRGWMWQMSRASFRTSALRTRLFSRAEQLIRRQHGRITHVAIDGRGRCKSRTTRKWMKWVTDVVERLRRISGENIAGNWQRNVSSGHAAMKWQLRSLWPKWEDGSILVA